MKPTGICAGINCLNPTAKVIHIKNFKLALCEPCLNELKVCIDPLHMSVTLYCSKCHMATATKAKVANQKNIRNRKLQGKAIDAANLKNRKNAWLNKIVKDALEIHNKLNKN